MPVCLASTTESAVHEATNGRGEAVPLVSETAHRMQRDNFECGMWQIPLAICNRFHTKKKSNSGEKTKNDKMKQ
jgi:hypothetical protein